VSWIRAHAAIRAADLPPYQPLFPERADDPRITAFGAHNSGLLLDVRAARENAQLWPWPVNPAFRAEAAVRRLEPADAQLSGRNA
jgi:hypothetical protein